jgi:hypothetical protein
LRNVATEDESVWTCSLSDSFKTQPMCCYRRDFGIVEDGFSQIVCPVFAVWCLVDIFHGERSVEAIEFEVVEIPLVRHQCYRFT